MSLGTEPFPDDRSRPGFGRRRLLVTALLAPLAACADPPRAGSTDPGLAELERKYGARLGLYAVATGSGATATHRADERFAFCSTFKTLAAAAALDRRPPSYLDTVVPIGATDVNSISPITKLHVGAGLTISALCDAAIRFSDGTAGNLLMREIGGPAQLTGYLRGLGDPVGRIDQYEPGLNRNPPGDPRDTTTPRALAEDHRKLVLGEALTPPTRALITDWMRRNTTGATAVRAGLPPGWNVADKTGHGDYGRTNDVAIGWPPTGAPIVIAVMCDRGGYDATPPYPIIAEATARVMSVLG